ncbi:unnamed protein product [Strongylus vulgaris]|uniref:Uncharacterized protein n=1 Tax=Strongylus vulgaris TaxID=40348 RepID=A0A3P7IB95_STRVU|nr:unnamed protein product [Strongylus vulgaris]
MNDINKWREEESLNLTSDISSDGSDRSEENVDTSTNTLMPQNSTADTSAILISQTPVAAHNTSGASATPGRLSLSQPILSNPVDSPASNRLNMSAGNIARPPRPQRVPLVKTQEENEQLRHQLVELNAKLRVADYKVMELERMLPREVKDILEEYYSLQNSRLDLITEREELAAARRQLQVEAGQMDLEAQRKLDKLSVKLSTSEKERNTLKKENEELRKRIEELEKDLAAIEEIPTSLDALKGEDSDWTIRSEYDVDVGDLREQLYIANKENKVLRQKIEGLQKEIEDKSAASNDVTSQGKDGQTFVIGGGHDAETLLQRIDGLEARLREEQDERAKANTALAAYMSRYHKLEKKLQEANMSVGNTSLKVNNKEEVKAVVAQLRDLLRHLGSENKELRKECARLLKEHSVLSANSTDASGRNDTANEEIAHAGDSVRAETDFEEKVCSYWIIV